MDSAALLRRSCYVFVILMGIVSLFSDICYEGARSIAGPFLASLGATGAVVGIVSGTGELIGYVLRYFSGLLSDRLKNYWVLTIIGYAINVLSVPLLALANSWQMASAFLITERIGKALRTPPRDVMLSYASERIGRGVGFGIHKALDQVGALIGPLMIATILFLQGSYRVGFAAMIIPAILCLLILFIAQWTFPRPKDLESHTPRIHKEGWSNKFWLYITAICCFAFGFVDFPLIAYFYAERNLVSETWIPILYAIAMAANGLAALFLGRLYDQKGISILIYVALASAFMAPFAFSHSFAVIVLGMILWGMGMGALDSVIRAFVAELVPSEVRGEAYGLFNMCFGIAWFFGSVLMGIVYNYSVLGTILISAFSILLSIPFLIKIAAMEGES